MTYDCEPTVTPFPGFNVTADAAAVHEALQGENTDKQAILDILTIRSNSQRQAIAEAYHAKYGTDIVEDLQSEEGGKFEYVIVAIMMPPEKFLCTQLNKAMEGWGTEMHTLIEILCPQSNYNVTHIANAYEHLYDRPLSEHLCTKTSGWFRRFLALIITGTRDAEGRTNPAKAKEQAEQLYEAGEAKFGTDEDVFYRILGHASFDQLRLIFEEYKKITGTTIEQALKYELSGELFDAMTAIVECVQSPALFFASLLSKAIHRLRTDEATLIRIIVSRSEIDLENIKQEFELLDNRSLLNAVKVETTGDCRHALCALIGDP